MSVILHATKSVIASKKIEKHITHQCDKDKYQQCNRKEVSIAVPVGRGEYLHMADGGVDAFNVGVYFWGRHLEKRDFAAEDGG